MRVIAGAAKGRRVRAPRGLAVRPTSSRLRESAFAMLEHRGAVAGARVLDLFAGTGALGIEALSRGAASLTAVERDRAVARVLAENLERCGLAGRARVLVAPVARALADLVGQEPFDLAFADPPYRSGLLAEALRLLARHSIVAPGGRIVVEHARGESIEAATGYVCEVSRRYGDSELTVLRCGQGQATADGERIAAHGVS